MKVFSEIESFHKEFQNISVTEKGKFKILISRVIGFLEAHDKAGNSTYEKLTKLYDKYFENNTALIHSDDIDDLNSYLYRLNYLFNENPNFKLKSSNNIDPRKIFVAHGRNIKIRDEFYLFLKKCGVIPMDFAEFIPKTGQATPYIGDALDAGFAMAKAVIILLTPDDEVILKQEFHSYNEPEYEKLLKGQARPNVIFEAGMAFVTHRDSTLVVQIGEMKPFSDIFGRHYVKFDGSTYSRQQIIDRLKTAGCEIKTKRGWDKIGNFNLTIQDSKPENQNNLPLLKKDLFKPDVISPNFEKIKSDILRYENGYIHVSVNIKEIHDRPTGRNMYILSVFENEIKNGVQQSFSNAFAIVRKAPHNTKDIGFYKLLYSNENGGHTWIEKQVNLSPGEHHFIVSWSISKNLVHFYIDKNLVGSKNLSGLWPSSFLNDFTIGGWPTKEPRFNFESEINVVSVGQNYFSPKEILNYQY